MLNLKFQHKVNYSIMVTPGPAAFITSLLDQTKASSVHILADAGLPASLTQRVQGMIGPDCFLHAIQGGEKLKTWDGIQTVLDLLSAYPIDRQTLLVALGGGTIGDAVGFVASLLRRGILYIQYPTSLLAQVDSAIGGKTGINTKDGKNLIGSFYHPVAVICDLTCLATVSKRDMAAGYAEILKYALIGDTDFWHWLQDNGRKIFEHDPDCLQKAIETSCQQKIQYVEQDPFDQGGKRALLNFGHSFGHALEGVVKDDAVLNHGEAVAIGMSMAAHLSVFLGYADQNLPGLIENNLKDHRLATAPFHLKSFNLDQMVFYLGQDKKHSKQGHHFILLKEIGQAFMSDPITDSTLNEFLAYYKERKNNENLC